MLQLEDYIVAEAISPQNVLGFLLEALKFNSLKIISKSLEIIEDNFESLIKIKENFHRIRELPFASFTRLLSSDGLAVNKEDIVLQVIIEYIYSRETEENLEKNQKIEENSENLRENLEKNNEKKDEKTQEKPEISKENNVKNEKKPEIPQENAVKILEKNVENPENPSKKDDKKPKEPEEKKSSESSNPLEKPLSEIKKPLLALEDSTYLLGEVPDLNSLHASLFSKHKLSTEEKLSLLLCCRLSYVDHDLLLKVSNMPSVEEFKSVFIEGISAKLLNYESATHEYTINLRPRDSYKDSADQNKEKIHQQFDQNPPVNFYRSMQNHMQNIAKTQQNEKSSDNLRKSQEVAKNSLFKPYLQKNIDRYSKNEENSQNLRNSQEAQFSQQRPQFSPQKTQQVEPPHQYSQPSRNAENSQQNLRYSQPHKASNPYGQDSHFSEDPLENDDRNPGKYLANSTIKQPLYRSEEIAKIKLAQSLSPLEFIYKYDFDDNGIFYYLGSLGKSARWQNPCELSLVEVRFSSIGSGVKCEDFIGRECVNCCTRNEKNAYMSVDLGEDRSLFPVCYTIRNRPSKKYVLMNWILEGSVNENEWYIIDKRINLTEDSHFNGLMMKEREELMQKGQSSTWGIDEENVEGILKELNRKNKATRKGFRLFRITQVMKNSDGEFNLCLSGLELYGSGFGNKWYF